MSSRPPPAGAVAAGAVLASLLGALLWTAMVAAPWRFAGGLLESADRLRRAESKLAGGSFKRARYEALSGAAAAERAGAGLAGPNPLLDLARMEPRAEALLREAPHLVAAAEHSAAAAEGSLDILQGALQGPEAIVERGEEGSRIRLDRVAHLSDLVAGIRASLGAARRELAAVDPSHLPRRLRPRVSEGIRRADEASLVLDDAAAGFERLPAILGAEGRRLYLLAMQNPAELRGTGGSILRFAMLALDDGVPELLADRKVYDVDRDRRPLTIDVPADAWYVRGIEDARRFGNANWSPDWPLSARLTLRYARASEAPFPAGVDGVIAVDPVVMKELMPGVGQFRTEGDRRVTSARVVPFLLHRAYALKPNPGKRRIVLQQWVDAFYENLFDPKRPPDLIEGLSRALAQKHMQIYLARRDEMAFVTRMNWDGAIERGKKTDYLYVVEQNVGGNKLDYVARHSHTVNIDVRGKDALVSTTIEVDNGVFLPQPRYWLGNAGPCHRPMLNLYAPADAELLAWDAPEPAASPTGCSGFVRRLDSPPPAAWAGGAPAEHAELGRSVWSATLEIPPGESGSVRWRYRVPGVVRTERNRRTYRLVLQRQPKVHPDEVTVSLRLPEGATEVRAPGWKRRAGRLVWQRALTRDRTLEVSWR